MSTWRSRTAFEGSSAARLAVLRRRADRPGGNRQAFRVRRPAAVRPDSIRAWYLQRWLRDSTAAKRAARPAAHRSGDRGSGGPLGSRQLRLGDRIVGALANPGHPVSDQTVGNILRRRGITPVPEGSQTTTWRDSISPAHGRSRRHLLLPSTRQVRWTRGRRSGRYRVIRTSNSIVFHLHGGAVTSVTSAG
jgi:hypothetical protein